MAIRDDKTGRHVWYDADHGVQRDPLRDAIRDHFPTSREGWNVNDVDLRVCLFGDALGRPKEADGWLIEFEVKKHNANLKHSQVRVMELTDRLASSSDPSGEHWGGCWLLKIPADIESGEFRAFRPYTMQNDRFCGVDGLCDWIAEKAMQMEAQHGR